MSRTLALENSGHDLIARSRNGKGVTKETQCKRSLGTHLLGIRKVNFQYGRPVVAFTEFDPITPTIQLARTTHTLKSLPRAYRAPIRQRVLNSAADGPPLPRENWSACGRVSRPDLTHDPADVSRLSLERSVDLARSPTDIRRLDGVT